MGWFFKFTKSSIGKKFMMAVTGSFLLIFLIIHLVGTKSNRDAIGTRVRLTADGKTQINQKKGGCGYLSQNDPRLHFGLGELGTVEKIEIIWPSGKDQILENVKVNQILVIEEET